MKKFFYRCLVGSWSVLALGLLLVAGAGAHQVEVSSTLNPVGSGARATGMGGSFISVADDAAAAYGADITQHTVMMSVINYF